MPDAPTFDPDLRGLARWLPQGVGRRWLLPILRLGPRHGAPKRLPTGLTFREQQLGPDKAVSVRIFSPETGSQRPVLLWIHGGGFMLGTARADDSVACAFASELGAVVVSVEYRWAPENPFPTPLHDCLKAFEFIHAEAATLGIDPARVIIAGRSAGGGLAAALTFMVHDRGLPAPALQLLIYPMLDDRTVLKPVDGSMHRLWDQESNLMGWQSYLGKPPGSDGIDSLAAPARREDLSNLPRAWVGVGTHDLFFDEDVAWANRLKAAGVTVDLEIVEGAFHGFDAVAPGAPVSRRFHEAQLRAIRAALNLAP